MTADAIRVERLGKRFRIFHERPRSLKELVALRRRRTFSELWALRDVSFTVGRGETVAVIGSNGSGKSTLMKCLARILVPEEGSIAVQGRLGALLELGAGFHPELTGRENVFLSGAILGVSRRDLLARFDEIVAMAGIERFIDTPVKNYSSGMYIRLAFAVAVSVRPDVLLVDEVLAVGDEDFQRRSMAAFHDMRSTGRTVVLVTHALTAVRQVCDRAIWLQDGRVARVGPAAEVAEAYLSHVAGGDPAATSPSVSLASVEFAGDDRRGGAIETGRVLRVRLHWLAHAPVGEVTFILDVFGPGGAHLAQVASNDAPPIRRLEGEGTAEFTVSQLPLGPGEYRATTTLVYSGGAGAEYVQQTRPLVVVAGTTPAASGLVRLPGSWVVTQVVQA
ncbi:MAG TPA: polysaccharide ABC transporter ATP-binding protein [Vicinamibacteria bacterium]